MQIYAGFTTRRGPQTSDVSLWPLPSAWEKSGLNVHFWSFDCEAWYTRHEAKLASGTTVLRTNEQWKHALKLNPSAPKVAKHNDTLCFGYLESVVTPS